MSVKVCLYSVSGFCTCGQSPPNNPPSPPRTNVSAGIKKSFTAAGFNHAAACAVAICVDSPAQPRAQPQRQFARQNFPTEQGFHFVSRTPETSAIARTNPAHTNFSRYHGFADTYDWTDHTRIQARPSLARLSEHKKSGLMLPNNTGVVQRASTPALQFQRRAASVSSVLDLITERREP